MTLMADTFTPTLTTALTSKDMAATALNSTIQSGMPLSSVVTQATPSMLAYMAATVFTANTGAMARAGTAGTAGIAGSSEPMLNIQGTPF